MQLTFLYFEKRQAVVPLNNGLEGTLYTVECAFNEKLKTKETDFDFVIKVYKD